MPNNCIVIGGGHNGLVAAAYLAQAGKNVTVLERRHVLGGCASTENLWPGFKVSPAAYVISLFLPQIIRDLRLKENGLEILPRVPSSFSPDLAGGPGILLGPDAARNHREIARYNPADAEQYPRYDALLTQVAEVVEPLLMQAPPCVLPFGPRPGFFGRLGELNKARKLAQRFARLGERIPEAVELLTGAAAPILERFFQNDLLKATLATDAIIGSFTSPHNPGSAYVLLHHVMGETGGARGVWGYVRGGMGGLADALERTCQQLGVTIVREAEVAQIAVDERTHQATGVVTAEGKHYPAEIVASSVDANLTIERFLSDADKARLPAEYLQRIRAIDYNSASAKINLALDALPQFVGAVETAERVGYCHGTIHMCPDMQFIERAYHDAMLGQPSSEPVLEATIPSTVDNTLAPPGKHVMSLFVQYVPYREPAVGDVDWHEVLFDRSMQVLSRYAPGIESLVLEKQILLPTDLERIYGLTGGNIFQGAMSLHQLGPFRTPYQTPIAGLYLCGAATHPGGGVMGACGKNAAEAILGS